ncbi:MAG: hypothetical protein B7C54_11465 [Acidimicrobiales bacterium mtb01]|nr:hypothetical protein [Actinomycetota bacterium]TEX45665.1 MAG: hypothetical protein B7C54_11465 [Acidimicrobiales bacterium mtb01]
MRRLIVSFVTAGFVLASCGGDDSSSTVDSSPVTTEGSIASPTDPAATAPPTSSIEVDVPESGTPSSETAFIEVDLEDGAPATASVVLGQDVTIVVTADEEHEFHLHGYDIELTGTEVSFEFVADRAGEFELETHDTGELVLTLSVAPE